ncbi:MAG: FUSC family protein [Gulosibacter sp.]|uniref:FUSC family protein n=1 Tax=Gulosibacter sp. TaxID=2817531 RepID=UPI003F91069C
MKLSLALRIKSRAPLLQVAKTGVAIVLAWFAASFLLQVDMPIFAAIATLLVVAPSVNQSLEKGIERSLGVVLGVVIAILGTLLLGTESWAVLVSLIVALAAAWVVRASPGVANQMVISAMLVIALGQGSLDYSLLRIVETVIGAVVGIAVNMLIVPPVLVGPAREKLAALGAETAATMVRLADALVERHTPGELQGLMIEARLIRPMRDAAAEAIDAGFESLMLNPRRSKHRADLEEMKRLLDEVLSPISTQVLGMTRAYFDHYSDSLADEPATHDIADQLDRAAHDVRLAVHEADVNPDPMTSMIPALTAPLELRPPQGGNWILIGALMEDLRRIRLGLVPEEAAEEN